MSRDWRPDALNVSEWEAWDRVQRKRLGFFAGLQFFHANNTGGVQFASRHWPHRLCWDWTIGWHPFRQGYDARRLGFWRATCGDYFEIGLWFGRIIYSWQNSQWMARSGAATEAAPKIMWKHHIAEERANSPALH